MKGGAVRAAVCGSAVVVLLALTLATAPPAEATAPGLMISAPVSASLGTTTVRSGSLSAPLGSVTVTTTAGVLSDASWTASVTATAFVTGGGTASETIPAGNVSYLAGAPTARTGFSASACVPGQATPVSLSTAQTAYTCNGVALVSATSLTWNPTITITIPPSAVTGTYSGTITHSVA